MTISVKPRPPIPIQIVAAFSPRLSRNNQPRFRWFVYRWSTETTFQEIREHLGAETQRQWSDLAITRTTPALLGLFSLITLWTAEAKVTAVLQPRSAAWYVKDELTFSDAIATVRRVLWSAPNLSTSRKGRDTIEIPIALLQRLTEALCYAT